MRLKMDSENTVVKIKKVSFDWKEVNKSELSSCYRVVCKITTENSLEVEGSHFYTWFKSGATPLGGFNNGSVEINTEHEAFKLAFSRVQEVLSLQIMPRQNNWN